MKPTSTNIGKDSSCQRKITKKEKIEVAISAALAGREGGWGMDHFQRKKKAWSSSVILVHV
jgi:hypothetical protein